MEFALLIGLLLGASFGGGALAHHVIEHRSIKIHKDSLQTPQNYRDEAKRLIWRATHTSDLYYASHLRQAALAYLMQADLLEKPSSALDIGVKTD